MKIAVLLATFNRREKTVSCLRNLFDQPLPDGVELEVFLTDDVSSDGTQGSVKREFPQVNLFNGSGSLFWAGGMRNSWNEAKTHDFDFYLLLNDDTLLRHDAISTLAYQASKSEKPTIYIGSTADSKGKISYGGHKLYSKNKVQSFNLYSEIESLECDLGNANIMLVPREVVNSIGILSDSYTHSIADFDYTLRAQKAGFKAIVLPGIMGHCIDDHGNNWKSAKVSLSDRIKYLKSPKGLAYDEYLYFIKKHFPMHFPAAFMKLWLKTLFPSLWDKFKVHGA
jgi:GT2 family glycosyltransferase